MTTPFWLKTTQVSPCLRKKKTFFGIGSPTNPYKFDSHTKIEMANLYLATIFYGFGVFGKVASVSKKFVENIDTRKFIFAHF